MSSHSHSRSHPSHSSSSPMTSLLSYVGVVCILFMGAYQHWRIMHLESSLRQLESSVVSSNGKTLKLLSQESESRRGDSDSDRNIKALFLKVQELERSLDLVSLNPYLHKKSPEPRKSAEATTIESKSGPDRFNQYRGKGDKVHLGGFIQKDYMTISQNMWNYMLGPLAVKSLVDVGCGKGYSASYFREQGARVLCVEGSRDAIKSSLLPRANIVEHDFSLGPYWPSSTYDVAYSTEFMEHLGRQHIRHYIGTFKKSALIMFSASAWGGWHHVEVHDQYWWIARFEAAGFVYSMQLTRNLRKQATNDPIRYSQPKQKVAHYCQVLRKALLVFINPSVASLPEHSHLIGGYGCFGGINDNNNGGKACEGPDSLPKQYDSLLLCNKTRQNPLREWDTVPWACRNSSGLTPVLN